MIERKLTEEEYKIVIWKGLIASGCIGPCGHNDIEIHFIKDGNSTRVDEISIRNIESRR